MKRSATGFLALTGAAIISATALFTPGCTCGPSATPRLTQIERVTYHGWKNSWRLTSRTAEVIVVPQVGRVMSFRRLDGENVFWEDRSLDGKHGDASAREWINFGGDKTWPAPETEWNKYTGHKQWMPPAAFDSMAVEARVTNNAVILTSPVDPHYGVRTIRQIRLTGTTLQIKTTYERISGEPSRIGIWVITQFKDPAAVYVPINANSRFPGGHFKFGNEPWPQLEVRNKYVEIVRDPKTPHKMGSDADRLIWVGEKDVCVVGSTRYSTGDYPDRGASAEVYTNPDPKKYVELEMLGPLSPMKPGDEISFDTVYTIYRRTTTNPVDELN